jgi:hypothetical protein
VPFTGVCGPSTENGCAESGRCCSSTHPCDRPRCTAGRGSACDESGCAETDRWSSGCWCCG